MNFNWLVDRFRLPKQQNREQAMNQRDGYFIENGLPPGLEWETLNSLCIDQFSTGVSQLFHQHLSAWKVSGAYRLFIHLANGKEIQLIYKESSYDPEQIPGLIGLPVNLAIPEYIIYQQSTLHPLDYLPKVYLAEEMVPGEKYHYLVEDLSLGYNRIKSGVEVLHVCAQFSETIDMLQEWAGIANLQGLIQYDHYYSTALQNYAFDNFHRLDPYLLEPIYYQIINQWPEICKIHLSNEFLDYSKNSFIHGDFNYSNIHVHKADPTRIKIVDWEWAGVGTPLSDFVSLIKGTPDNMETSTFMHLVRGSHSGQWSQTLGENHRQLKRMISWCKLERGMLDAGFLSAQLISQHNETKFSLPKAINRSLAVLYHAYEELSNERG
jgi:hypothetical protein